MKPTMAEVDARVLKVAEWLVAGWSRARICENARENEGWDVSDSQVDRYIVRDRAQIKASFEDDWAANRSMAAARLEDLYCAAREKGDLRTALSVVREQVSLQAPETTKVVYERDGDFMSCLYAYAEALRRIVPTHMLVQVNEAVRGLEPVEESLEKVIGFDYDEAMQAAG